MTSQSAASDALTPESRERLERMVIGIVGVATECDRATRQKLIQVAERLSMILEE